MFERELRSVTAERDALLEVLDTLTVEVGLTPIAAGNKEALQEAYNLATAAIASAKKEATPPLIDAARGGSHD